MANVLTQLNMWFDKRLANEKGSKEEYDPNMAAAQMRREKDSAVIENQRYEIEQMKGQMMQRQLEHQLIMSRGPPPPYPNQVVQQPQYDMQAPAAAMGGAVAGGLAAGALLCSIM